MTVENYTHKHIQLKNNNINVHPITDQDHKPPIFDFSFKEVYLFWVSL